jgi:hypothetical protein
MNRERIKGFIIGVLMTVLVFSISFSSFALVGTKNITVGYNNIKIYINQKLITPKDGNGNIVEPFVYNGTTFLPVRAISEALGQQVSWDAVNKAVYVGSQPSGVPAPSITYSRNNPAPLNTAQTINYSSYFDAYNATVSVTEIIRGADAWSMIKAANMFNDEPKAGYEYVLAKIKITMNSVKDDAAYDIYGFNFTPFSSDNAEYVNMTTVVTPEPALSGKMFAGSTKEGYVEFEVKISDPSPKFVFGAAYDGTGGIWFKLNK